MVSNSVDVISFSRRPLSLLFCISIIDTFLPNTEMEFRPKIDVCPKWQSARPYSHSNDWVGRAIFRIPAYTYTNIIIVVEQPFFTKQYTTNS